MLLRQLYMLLYIHLFEMKYSNLNCPFYQLHLYKYHNKYWDIERHWRFEYPVNYHYHFCFELKCFFFSDLWIIIKNSVASIIEKFRCFVAWKISVICIFTIYITAIARIWILNIDSPNKKNWQQLEESSWAVLSLHSWFNE